MVKKPKDNVLVKMKKNISKARSYADENDDEEFIKPNEYLTNEALNEEEENFNEDIFDEKDEALIEKLKSLDGRRSKRLRTEVVSSELDVNISTFKFV
jgi:hypothetical protein